MEDQLATALIARMQPILYFIGLGFVLFMVSFGGTIISLFWKGRGQEQKKLLGSIEDLKQDVVALTISHAKMESKLDTYIDQSNKDLNNLGNKSRNLQV